ncbi:MAG TPA: multicopper oxidase family protein [Streptosporangiaceae bacterium]|jgi:FtsP/CotA-like multicopper oxidase with cupredoxin domain
MSTSGLVALDLIVAVVAAAAWLGAGVAAASGRARSVPPLFAVALLVTFVRVGTVVTLAGSGWWFVQEKATVALPLLGAAALAAVVIAGPRLRAVRSPAVVVPLLTAGYATVAGVVVTFLVGYPASLSVGLIAAALVGAAAFMTWRLVAPATPAWRMEIGGAATLAVGVAGVSLAFAPFGGQSGFGGLGGSDRFDAGGGPAGTHRGDGGTAVTALTGPAGPDSGGTVRRYTLTARTTTVALASGRRITAWAFNGQVPGPPITATQGDLVEVTLRNADIGKGVTLHWHGYDVPSAEDGAPGLTQDAVRPGQQFVYRFRAAQTGTYWYHTHEASALGVRMGLYGSVVVTPRAQPPRGVDLTVPVHTFAGSAVVGDPGRPATRRVPPGAPVRLRLINTDSAPRRLTLTGTSYRLVAVDGTNLNQPGPLSRVALALAPGGRYDVVFTMPPGPVALLVGDRAAGGLRLSPDGAAAAAVPSTAGWPELDLTRYGRPAPTPFGGQSRFDRRFTLVLDRGLALSNGLPRYAYTVNGRAFPRVPTELVRRGDLVEMTVVNRGFDTHPWHLHGHHVLVLSKNGHPATGSPLWMDTFDVRPGDVWRVAFRADNPGLWMNHCHNLAHAAQGMALHLAYEGVTTPFHGAHGG